MTQKQLAALAIRVLAIYAIINSFSWLMTSISMLSIASRVGSANAGSNPLWQYALAFLPFFLYSAFGVLLWICADALAFSMADYDDRNLIATRLSPVEVLTVAFCIAGLWFALTSLPQLARVAVVSLSGSSSNSPRFTGNIPLPLELILTFAQIAVGLGLFFNAHNIANKLAARYQLSQPVDAELS